MVRTPETSLSSSRRLALLFPTRFGIMDTGLGFALYSIAETIDETLEPLRIGLGNLLRDDSPKELICVFRV